MIRITQQLSNKEQKRRQQQQEDSHHSSKRALSVRPDDILLHFQDEYAIEMSIRLRSIANSKKPSSILMIQSLSNVKVVQSNTVQMTSGFKKRTLGGGHAASSRRTTGIAGGDEMEDEEDGDEDDDDEEILSSQDIDDEIHCDHPYALIVHTGTVIELVTKPERRPKVTIKQENDIDIDSEDDDEDDEDDEDDDDDVIEQTDGNGENRDRFEQKFIVRFNTKNDANNATSSESHNNEEIVSPITTTTTVTPVVDSDQDHDVSSTSRTENGATGGLMTARQYAQALQSSNQSTTTTTTTSTTAATSTSTGAATANTTNQVNSTTTVATTSSTTHNTDDNGNSGGGASPKYTYTPIAQLPSSGRYNIYGIVIDYTNARSINGSDQVSLTITDESIDPVGARTCQPLTIRILAMRNQKYPVVMHIGQIIRIHRMGMSMWNNEKDGKLDFSSSFVLFKEDPQDLQCLDIDSTSAKQNTFHHSSERKRISELRQFRNTLLSDQAKMQALYGRKLQYQLSLKEIHDALLKNPKSRKWCDVVCKIIRLKRKSPTDRSYEMVVSDGTKFKKDRVKCMDPTYFGSEVTVLITHLPLINYIDQNVNRICPGQWCKLRNMSTFTSILPSDDNEMIYDINSGDKSSIVSLPSNYYHVQHLEQVFEKKQNKRKRKREQAEQQVAESLAKKSKASLWSTVRYSDAPVTALGSVLSNTTNVPYKYRCQAALCDFHVPDQSRYSDVLFQVCLQENESKLVAYVQGMEARFFLDIEQDTPVSNELIRQKLKRAKEANAHLDVCLVSFMYESTTKKTDERSVRYHLFGTKLNNDD